jgi:hypothetical protein
MLNPEFILFDFRRFARRRRQRQTKASVPSGFSIRKQQMENRPKERFTAAEQIL